MVLIRAVATPTKICDLCKVPQSLFAFNRNRHKSDGLNSICRSCSNANSKRYYRQNAEKHKAVVKVRRFRVITGNRKQLRDYLLTHPCVDCDEDDPDVLEFDHVRGIKRTEVTKLASCGAAWSTVEAEIAKCEVRCANCHRRRTRKQQRDRGIAVCAPDF